MRRRHYVTKHVRCLSCIDFMYVHKNHFVWSILWVVYSVFRVVCSLRVLVISNNFIFK